MSWHETAFGSHYAWLYAHRDAAEAAACIDALAGILPLAEGIVLDLGCGEGRHLAPLGQRCPRGAVGVDLSPALLRNARALTVGAPPLGLIRADMRSLPFGGGVFRTVVSLFTSFGYFGGLEDHRDLLAGIARVLAPGGRWCLDYLNCRQVRRDMAEPRTATVREAGPCRVTETKRLDPDGDRILKRVEIAPLPGRRDQAAALGIPETGLAYTEAVALFEPEELDALASSVGLERCGALGGYDGRAFAPDAAARWILVYGKDRLS
ncbi:methyltransferase domain-containing protein [bacterium]|nr:methyltransferase domain-containing protein [bacterium]MBU1073980.1 methyltransferase domain-containing protein [bacterium]MBU1674252.1 methyltransferase domain-containing protein [bacterium]